MINVIKSVKEIAKAIIEQQEHGQLSPETIDLLKVIINS
jgi:hypothetical protein